MKTFSMTDIGRRREINQDDMFTSEMAVGSLPNLFLVADGMGGHKAGEYASKFTIETIVECIRASQRSEPVALLKEAVAEANSRLLKESRTDYAKNGMGTTVVAATFIDGCLYVANVGDSRLYIINQESIRQITRDHSLVAEMVRMGEVKKAEAREHPDRNVITRAVGVLPAVEADFFEIELNAGDTVLMCTDGLTNMVEDEDIKKIILSQRDIVEKAEKLVEAANKNGGRDNITVVLVEPFSDDVA